MTLQDISNKVYFLTGTNSTSFPNASLLLLLNTAFERVCSVIDQADSRWEWDDTNQTDLPIATTSLVANQQDYSLATSHLTIDRVEIKDQNGNWTVLDQIDQQLLKRDKKQAMADYRSTAGTPIEYDVIGSSVFLYPKPSYSQDASLKLYFTRGPVAYTDTANLTSNSLVPGFNALFHNLIPLWISYEYSVAKGLPNANGLLAEIQRGEQSIKDFYGLRNRDQRKRLSVSTDSNK